MADGRSAPPLSREGRRILISLTSVNGRGSSCPCSQTYPWIGWCVTGGRPAPPARHPQGVRRRTTRAEPSPSVRQTGGCRPTRPALGRRSGVPNPRRHRPCASTDPVQKRRHRRSGPLGEHIVGVRLGELVLVNGSFPMLTNLTRTETSSLAM